MDFQELCRLFPEGPKLLRQALKDMPKEAWEFRPELEDAWTISEHVRHVVDSEANFYLRAKLSVAEPGAVIMALDEEVWAHKVYPPNEELEPYLELFEQLRKILYIFLKGVSAVQAEEAWVTHPVHGRMTLKNILMIYVRHVYSHLEYLERNRKAFFDMKG